MPAMMEYEFTLPRGYVDAAGQVHRHGRMRLATARDEIESMQHPYVQASEAYLSVVLLSRVVMALGEQVNITPQLMADLFAVDLTFLEDLYQRLNTVEGTTLAVVCPHCSQPFALEMAPMAEVET